MNIRLYGEIIDSAMIWVSELAIFLLHSDLSDQQYFKLSDFTF